MGPVSYLVLGLIGLRGASTPYELKRTADRTVHYFWPFSHSQLYGEPDRLAAAGLLAVEQEATGRRKKTYSLTPEGRQALTDWLKEAPQEIYEYRDMALMQMFFSEFMSTEDLVTLAQTQARLCRERIALYQDIEGFYADRDDFDRRLSPLRFGIGITQATLTIWEDIAANPPPTRKSPPGTPD